MTLATATESELPAYNKDSLQIRRKIIITNKENFDFIYSAALYLICFYVNSLYEKLSDIIFEKMQAG